MSQGILFIGICLICLIAGAFAIQAGYKEPIKDGDYTYTYESNPLYNSLTYVAMDDYRYVGKGKIEITTWDASHTTHKSVHCYDKLYKQSYTITLHNIYGKTVKMQDVKFQVSKESSQYYSGHMFYDDIAVCINGAVLEVMVGHDKTATLRVTYICADTTERPPIIDGWRLRT